MASQLNFKELQDLSAEILGIDPDQVQMDKSFQRDLAADSLDLVELIAAIEDKYDVELPDAELENMKTIADLWKFLEQKTAERLEAYAPMAITTSYRTRSDAVPLRSFKAKGRPSAIAGVGVYAPKKIISNFDLEKMMDTSDKWIIERTGIRRRHIAEPGTTTFELATKAARSALDAAGVAPKDLDMILGGTASPDGPF